jgi:hypothetical protein
MKNGLMLTPSGVGVNSIIWRIHRVSPRLGSILFVCIVYSRANFCKKSCKNGTTLHLGERRVRVYKSWQWLIFHLSLAIVSHLVSLTHARLWTCTHNRILSGSLDPFIRTSILL